MTHISDFIIYGIIIIIAIVWWCKKNLSGYFKGEKPERRVTRQQFMYSLIAPDELVEKTKDRLAHENTRRELLKEFMPEVKFAYGDKYEENERYIDFEQRTATPGRYYFKHEKRMVYGILPALSATYLDYWLYLLAIAKEGYLPKKEFDEGIRLAGFHAVGGVTEVVTNIRFCQKIEGYLLKVNPYATVGFTRGSMSKNSTNPVMLDMAWGKCKLDAFLLREDWKFWEVERKKVQKE